MEKKPYIFTVTQEEWQAALEKAEKTIEEHSARGCSYGMSDGYDDYINECDCPEESNG